MLASATRSSSHVRSPVAGSWQGVGTSDMTWSLSSRHFLDWQLLGCRQQVLINVVSWQQSGGGGGRSDEDRLR